MKSLTSTILNKIKRFFSYIWTNKKSPKVFIPAIIVAIILLSSLFSGSAAAQNQVLVIEPKEFIQEVAVTGKVTPAQKVDLAFEVAGRVGTISTEVGARVKKGQKLATLSNAEYQATLQKSQATYQSEQARLAELQRGSRPEELAIASADVEVANQNVIKAKADLVQEIKNSYSAIDDAIKNKADQVFKNPRSNSPELIFYVDGNPAFRDAVQLQRLKFTEASAPWQQLAMNVTVNNLDQTKINQAKNYVAAAQRLISDLNTAVTTTGQNLSQDAQYQKYRTDIASARNDINGAAQELSSAETELNNAQSSLLREQETYRLKQSGASAEEIAAQRANALSASAGISSASASLNKTVLIAPFDGIVTRIEYKVGESVSGSIPVITIMSDAAFEIETFVSENDVPKLRIGQPAKVTLDALGDATIFEAVVSQVDLSETIKDGVVTYRSRLQFMTQDERIKSGLTANVVVETDKREGVIKVPQTGIVISKGKKHVKLVPQGSTEWNQELDKKATLVPVTTGSIDRDGDLEIVEGVKAGDAIIVKGAAPVVETE